MKKKEIKVSNSIDELVNIQQAVEDIAEIWSLPAAVVFNLNLVIEELFSNTVFYGFDDEDKHEIVFNLTLQGEVLQIKLIDDGKAFNPFEVSAEEEISKSVEEREIGGLGIHFVKTLMDEYSYNRKNNQNIITLKKKIN